MSFKVAVHAFVAAGDTSPTRIAQQLEHGRDLVVACSNGEQWVTPQPTITSSAFALRPERLYRYRVSPPRLTTSVKSAVIPEWGQPSLVDDLDHSRLHDLQEFESTHVQTLPRRSEIVLAHPSHPRKRGRGGDVDADEPVKRPRIEACSLLDFIPQPHFMPAPAAKFRPVDTSKIPHYQKTSPLPILPYDTAAVNRLLNSTYRRAAWLIPVRGSLPWDSASTAVILEGTQLASRSPSPCLHASAAHPPPIVWTPHSLHHLWSFLRSIQQAKHLGPLSLSFHAAPVDTISTSDMSSEPVWESNQPYYHYPLSPEQTAPSPHYFMSDMCRAQLEGTDYIKVFHDIPYSLSLRNILDAYRYEPVNGDVPGRSGANDRKIRTLKGAHLVLMDEHSKAAFLM